MGGVYSLMQSAEAEKIFIERVVAPAGVLDIFEEKREELRKAADRIDLKNASQEDWVDYLRREYHGNNFIASHQCINAHEFADELAEEVVIRLRTGVAGENLQKRIKVAASAHDVSRPTFSIHILYGFNPDDIEMKYLNLHPYTTLLMIEPIKQFRHLWPTILLHEERYSGGGPIERFINEELKQAGLAGSDIKISGEDIPLSARLLKIPDTFASMVRRKKTPKEIEEVFREQRGKGFDPALVDIALDMFKEKERI